MKTHLFSWIFAAIPLALCGCVSNKIFESDPSRAPKCADLRKLYVAAADPELATLRDNVEIRAPKSIHTTFRTTFSLPGADSCLVQKSGVDFQYVCTWDSADNVGKLEADFRQIQSQMLTCLKEASVFRTPDSAIIRVESEAYNVRYWLTARDRYVRLRVNAY